MTSSAIRWDDPWPSAALSAHHGVSARLRVGGRLGCDQSIHLRSSELEDRRLWDSDTTGQGDPTRVGWVGRYAARLRQKLGLTVTVVNLAQEGMTSGQLLASVRSNSSTRSPAP